MACGEFAESIYKLIDDLGDTEEGRELVLSNLIKFLPGTTIESFVESFRNDYDMNDDQTEDFETNEYVLCIECQDTHHEDDECKSCHDEEEWPDNLASRFFSSRIPEC